MGETEQHEQAKLGYFRLFFHVSFFTSMSNFSFRWKKKSEYWVPRCTVRKWCLPFASIHLRVFEDVKTKNSWEQSETWHFGVVRNFSMFPRSWNQFFSSLKSRWKIMTASEPVFNLSQLPKTLALPVVCFLALRPIGITRINYFESFPSPTLPSLWLSRAQSFRSPSWA